jgi:hypothetical protein
LGSVGDSFDNAMAASWFGTIKIELISACSTPRRRPIVHGAAGRAEQSDSARGADQRARMPSRTAVV